MSIQKIFFFLFLPVFIFSCKKASTVTLNESVDNAAVVSYKGIFISRGGQTVTGTVKIYSINKTYQLRLEDFSTSNGPNLKVYLSKNDTPSDVISLGDLKSTNGNQVYDIQGNPDFKLYKYVLIHCERYNHLFGSAEIK